MRLRRCGPGAERQWSADFADALIVRKAMGTIRDIGESYEGTYTFDQPAQQLTGTQSP